MTLNQILEKSIETGSVKSIVGELKRAFESKQLPIAREAFERLNLKLPGSKPQHALKLFCICGWLINHYEEFVKSKAILGDDWKHLMGKFLELSTRETERVIDASDSDKLTAKKVQLNDFALPF
jgi:hypothetical protein